MFLSLIAFCLFIIFLFFCSLFFLFAGCTKHVPQGGNVTNKTHLIPFTVLTKSGNIFDCDCGKYTISRMLSFLGFSPFESFTNDIHTTDELFSKIHKYANKKGGTLKTVTIDELF